METIGRNPSYQGRTKSFHKKRQQPVMSHISKGYCIILGEREGIRMGGGEQEEGDGRSKMA